MPIAMAHGPLAALEAEEQFVEVWESGMFV